MPATGCSSKVRTIDVPGRANGLFAEALIATIGKPGLSLSQVFPEVQVAVNAASGGQQTPSSTSIIVKPFFFRDPLPKPPEPSKPPDGLNPGEVRANPIDQLSYVWIPPGEFRMGCSPDDDECSDYERTAHPVTVTRGFWMGQTEVTVGAHKRIASRGGGALPPGNEEYAARAGTTGARHGELDAIAWHRGNSDGKIHPARQKAPNGFRLYDMLGSVWEWVADWCGAKHYDASRPAGLQGLQPGFPLRAETAP